MDKPILHLNLKRKWFDMIFAGEKKEEYREMKTHWQNIFNDMFETKGLGHPIKIKIKNKFYNPKDIIIRFSNGYSKTRQHFDIKCKGVKVGIGVERWGAVKNESYFILELGEII